MIVRVQGSGQFHLDSAAVTELEALDHQLVAAVHADDEEQVHALLGSMIDLVQIKGSTMHQDDLVASDIVLPPSTITLEEVQALLDEDGLVSARAGQER